jgi:phosphatidylinositol alpha-1,6-mannosyltransferase
MRILIPTADYPPITGGISSVALHVSRELARLGHDVTVVAPRFPGVEASDQAEPVKVIRFRGYHLGWLRLLPLFAAAWPHAGNTGLILGINVSYGGIIGLWVRRRRGTPYVAFAYAYEFLKFRRHRVVRALLRRVYNEACGVVAISRFTRDSLVSFGVPADRIEVIHPGAPPARTISSEDVADVKRRFAIEGSRVILGVGRFVPRKGHVTLVRAMRRIIERIPGAALVLVGEGPRPYDAVYEANNLGMRGNVFFPASVSDDDLAALYQACEVFALPTGDDGGAQVEGFGLVFAEAGAYGKPVVAGRSGGVVDAVLDGETGLIVEPDQPEALADAILSLMENPARAQELGENGRRRVETELNWTRFTERLLQMVEARRS